MSHDVMGPYGFPYVPGTTPQVLNYRTQSQVRSDLSDEARKKANALIIIDVHARDIIDTFVRDSIMDAREFAWESQLRFYWDRTQDDILIRQCTGERQRREWHY